MTARLLSFSLSEVHPLLGVKGDGKSKKKTAGRPKGSKGKEKDFSFRPKAYRGERPAFPTEAQTSTGAGGGAGGMKGRLEGGVATGEDATAHSEFQRWSRFIEWLSNKISTYNNTFYCLLIADISLNMKTLPKYVADICNLLSSRVTSVKSLLLTISDSLMLRLMYFLAYFSFLPLWNSLLSLGLHNYMHHSLKLSRSFGEHCKCGCCIYSLILFVVIFYGR